MHLHWHRQDLRARDNVALARAADALRDSGVRAGGSGDGGRSVDPASGPEHGILPLFVLDDDLLGWAGAARVSFLLEALAALRDWYRERGGELLVVRGDPTAVVPAVASAIAEMEGGTAGEALVVRWNEDYTGFARERDAAVEMALTERDVSTAACTDAVLHAPGEITTNAGEHYQVFSYFGEKWAGREKPTPRDPPPTSALADVDDALVSAVRTAVADAGDGDAGDADTPASAIAPRQLPSLADLGIGAPEADVPDAGTAAARERLTAFCDGPIYRYATGRERPAERGTSRLSPHLSLGTVGIREVYAATERALEAVEGDRREDADVQPETAREGVMEFRRQLAWREFYTQVLAAEPATVIENHVDFEQPVVWRNDPEELAAWRAGETGFPLVDAGMRQLAAEAFVHNRVRMVVASFLTKDLLIDWREGYRHFREHLVDHDTANDVGGWQWAASTGADAQPFFRVFNPSSQAERFDPEGEYVRRWVPELADVPAARIHEWPSMDRATRDKLAPDYPDPIVDHAERREAAIAAYRRARGESAE